MNLGDTITLKANPGLILAVSEKTETFIKELIEAGEVNLERECMGFARDLVVMLGERSKAEEGEKEEKTEVGLEPRPP